jgi:2-polyprenyl-3-methyl-5-hydroxy-6-metoxy-1,4-benzoquinol methylase
MLVGICGVGKMESNALYKHFPLCGVFASTIFNYKKAYSETLTDGRQVLHKVYKTLMTIRYLVENNNLVNFFRVYKT